MTHITEIVPDLDKMPDWAREAFEDGQFFGVAFLRVERLEGGIVALQRYVVHGEVCAKGRKVWNGGRYETKPCDCGLDEVRAALKFTQAALNLAHAKITLGSYEIEKNKKGAEPL